MMASLSSFAEETEMMIEMSAKRVSIGPSRSQTTHSQKIRHSNSCRVSELDKQASCRAGCLLFAEQALWAVDSWSRMQLILILQPGGRPCPFHKAWVIGICLSIASCLFKMLHTEIFRIICLFVFCVILQQLPPVFPMPVFFFTWTSFGYLREYLTPYLPYTEWMGPIWTTTTVMFIILPWVLQSCPFPGSLVVVAIDPLLHMLRICLENSPLAWVRACADDIGMAMSRLRRFPLVQVLFPDFRCVSGLDLKAIECIIILNALCASPDNCDVLREWLNCNCPVWESMVVCNYVKYLCFFVGPSSGRIRWENALKTFRDIINATHALHLPAALAEGQFSSRALPSLGYIAQVFPPPKNAKRISMNAVMKCLHLCGNSFRNRKAFSLDCLGGPKFLDLSSYFVSATFRAPFKTIKGSEEQH